MYRLAIKLELTCEQFICVFIIQITAIISSLVLYSNIKRYIINCVVKFL